MNANPSFGANANGARPAASSAWRAGPVPPSLRTSPSPIKASAMWLSGARSPLAPTLPCSGTIGTTPALSNATRASTSSGRTPLVGRRSTLARSNMTARTTGAGSGAPTPAA